MHSIMMKTSFAKKFSRPRYRRRSLLPHVAFIQSLFGPGQAISQDVLPGRQPAGEA